MLEDLFYGITKNKTSKQPQENFLFVLNVLENLKRSTSNKYYSYKEVFYNNVWSTVFKTNLNVARLILSIVLSVEKANSFQGPLIYFLSPQWLKLDKFSVLNYLSVLVHPA